MKCILEGVPNEAGYSGLHLTDTTNGHIDLTGSISGIKVTQHQGPALGCLSGATEELNGKLDIDATIDAHDEEGITIGVKVTEPEL